MKKQNATKATLSNRKISKRELEWLELILGGINARDAGRRVGLNPRQAKRTNEWIKTHREDSRKPYLWDIWRAAIDRQLRILEAKSDHILRELCIVAFSSIDQFIELPSREDALAALRKDSETRSAIGIASEDDEERLAEPESEDQLVKRYRPGSIIKLKCVEDIPKDLIPAIAEIHETKEGIRIKLHSKMDALDKLARITKLFTQEPAEEQPFGGEINIHVNGSKSPLLLQIAQESTVKQSKK